MTRLYIVDQSLVNCGGHHYDYTTCVAEAAQAMGFAPVIAANKRLDCQAQFSNSVLHRVFENTVYQRDSYLAGLRQLKRCRVELDGFVNRSDQSPHLWTRLKRFYRHRSSQQRRRKIIQQFAADCRQLFSSYELGQSDHVFFTTVSELEMLGLTEYLRSDPKTIGPTWHLQFHFNLFHGRPPEYDSQSAVEELTRKCFQSAFSRLSFHRVRCHTTSLPLAEQYNRLKVVDMTPLPYPVAPQFASALAAEPVWADSFKVQGGADAAFDLPHYLTTKASTKVIADPLRAWDPGPRKGQPLQEEAFSQGEAVVRDIHAVTREVFENGNAFHGGEDYGPVDDLDSQVSRRPLRFTCPGQIRREKGCIEYLQPLVNALWDRHLCKGTLKIAVQRPQRKRFRNQKIELSVPSPRASDGEASEPIEYFNHPLGRSEYTDFIKNTDCGLLFYDSRTYYSRRAGVLGELLSAGKPLIVSAGSWLAEQVAETNFCWAENLRGDADSIRTLIVDDVRCDRNNVPSAGGMVSFDHAKHPFVASFNRFADEPFMLFSFDWQFPSENGTYAGISVTQKDSSGKVIANKRNVVGHRANQQSPVCLFRIHHDAKTIEVTVKNEYSQSTASFKNIRFEMLKFDGVQDSSKIPVGSVGVVAADQEDLVLAVDEMVAHFDHYRSTAEVFSSHWFATHHPTRCVARLITNC